MKSFDITSEEEKEVIQKLLTDTKKDTIKEIAKYCRVEEVVYRAIPEDAFEPASLEFVFKTSSTGNGKLAVKRANIAFAGTKPLDQFGYAVYKTDACDRLQGKEWHTLYFQMSFYEFILSCNSGTNLGSCLLSGIEQIFPNDYEAVLKEYNKNTFDSLESKAKALSYLLTWLNDKGIFAQLAEKADSRNQISGILGVVLTDNEWHALQHDWAAFCEAPEKFKGTAIIEMVHAWLDDIRASSEVDTAEEPLVKTAIDVCAPRPAHLQTYQQEGPELLPSGPPKRLELM